MGDAGLARRKCLEAHAAYLRSGFGPSAIAEAAPRERSGYDVSRTGSSRRTAATSERFAQAFPPTGRGNGGVEPVAPDQHPNANSMRTHATMTEEKASVDVRPSCVPRAKHCLRRAVRVLMGIS